MDDRKQWTRPEVVELAGRAAIEKLAAIFPHCGAEERRRLGKRFPLVDPERASEIRRFQIDLAELQARYGLEIKAGDDHTLDIYDTRRVMPSGYEWSAYIRGTALEIAEWVEE